MMVIVKGKVPVVLEGCIELFAVVSERVEMPRWLPVHISG